MITILYDGDDGNSDSNVYRSKHLYYICMACVAVTGKCQPILKQGEKGLTTGVGKLVTVVWGGLICYAGQGNARRGGEGTVIM